MKGDQIREDIEFLSKGLKCSGWLYKPSKSGEKLPTIVMAHGLSAVKEMYLQDYAKHFSEAGFACLVFDYRYLGESEGQPRGQIFPYQQIDDYQRAIAYAREREEVDEDRIGIWGSSYSGGHVLKLAACDSRVKAVVSQVPFIRGLDNAKAILGAMFESVLEGFIEISVKDEVDYLPVVSKEGFPALPGEKAYEWFTKTAEERAPNWENKITIGSLEKLVRYDPGSFAKDITVPSLLIVGEKDEITLPNLTIKTYEKIPEPKKLIELSMDHFEAYTTHFRETAEAAQKWFSEHLKR